MNVFYFAIVTSFFSLLFSSLISEGLYKKILLFFGISIYCLLIAFKGQAGSDTDLYYIAYSNYANDYKSFYMAGGFSEIGFWLINYFGFFSGFSFVYVNIVSAIFVFFSLYLVGVKKNPLLLLFYIPFVGFNIDFSTIRFSIAFHCFVILFLLFDRPFFSSVISGFFHKFGFLFFSVNFINVSFKKLKGIHYFFFFIVLAPIGYYFYTEFIERYLAYGSQFVFRDGFSFLLQSFLVLFICCLARFPVKNSIAIFLISMIPVGFRICGILILVSDLKKSSIIFNKVILYLILIFFFFAKLISFTNASLSIDGHKSIILHYSNFFI
ncbi:EpsG family protein [Vibrio parahaemolyticus]|uniref:EpsG family protein n=1 Tax=Vibrio parahaemolyticus TaxID=670 RepID=UPI000419BEAD|nr:EpsG family protein [Vibrio parahaemolyticus]